MPKTLLITGASSGIGRETALLAARRGWQVIVHYNSDAAAAGAVVRRIESAAGRALALQADLRSEREVERLYAEVDARVGALDAVVNSAGSVLGARAVTELVADDVASMIALNVIGLMVSCREAVKRLSRSRGGAGGTILNVSSMAATIGGRPGSAPYAASKAAVDAYSVGIAKDVAGDGIRVVSVRPGMVETEMTREVLADPTFAATVRASIPLGRPAQPEEVAAPLVWLLSEEASFISGCCIDISGGGFHIARAQSAE